MVAPVPAQVSKLPRRKLSCPSRRSTPNSCRLILLQTLLHSQSRQPLWNQVNPNSFAKTPEAGVPPFPFQSLTAHYPPLTTHCPLTTFRMNTYGKRGGGGYSLQVITLPQLRDTPPAISWDYNSEAHPLETRTAPHAPLHLQPQRLAHQTKNRRAHRH